MGPPNTVYQGGVWFLSVKFPEMYPLVPPELTFLTKIWHPNVCPDTGKVMINALKNSNSIFHNIEEILEILERKLSCPEVNLSKRIQLKKHSEPIERVHTQYLKNPTQFKTTAKDLKLKFAMKGQTLPVTQNSKQRRCFSLQDGELENDLDYQEFLSRSKSIFLNKTEQDLNSSIFPFDEYLFN